MHGDVTVTFSGFVATTPTLFTSPSGTDYTSFRIAQTRRYLDRERGEWVDGRTLWFTVKAFKRVARNVATSLHKGDPVVVTGRLSVDEWTGPDGPRSSLVVEATSLGHDLTLGESRFARTVHRRDEGQATARTGEPGDPAGDGPGTAAGEGASAALGQGAGGTDLPDDPWALPDVGDARDPGDARDTGDTGEVSDAAGDDALEEARLATA
jgi:single-strand DNA-binding protein